MKKKNYRFMIEVKKTHDVKIISVHSFKYIDAVRKVNKKKYRIIKLLRG